MLRIDRCIVEQQVRSLLSACADSKLRKAARRLASSVRRNVVLDMREVSELYWQGSCQIDDLNRNQ